MASASQRGAEMLELWQSKVFDQIGRWHDAELAYLLAAPPPSASYVSSGDGDAGRCCELERRLDHRSQPYIQRYTNPPEELAAQYAEGL